MHETEKVPADIVARIVSPKAYATQRDLMAGFRWLRHHNRLGLVEAEGFAPFWAVTTHADIVEIGRHPARFDNGSRSTALVPRAADDLARSVTGGSPHLIRTLLQMDGQVHARYRHVTQSWFTRQSVGSFEHRIRRLASRSVDRMAARADGCDFVRDVALQFALLAIMGILGIPEQDEPLLLDLLLDLLRSQDEAAAGEARASRDPARHARRVLQAFAGFERYFVPLMEERRKKPRDDLASVVAAAEIDGEPISQFDAVC